MTAARKISVPVKPDGIEQNSTFDPGNALAAQSDERVTAPSRRVDKVLVSSAKGGSGKTTTSINLATLAVGEGRRVLLVDLDSQETLTWWAKVRPAEAPAIDILTLRLPAINKGGIEVIETRILQTGADLVIIDCPPSVDDWPAESLRLIHFANMTLVPTGQGTPDLRSVTEWMLTLRSQGAPAAFLINQADRSQTTFEAAKRQLNQAGLLCSFDVRRLADIRNVFDKGIGVSEYAGSNAKSEFEQVWFFVRNMLDARGPR